VIAAALAGRAPVIVTGDRDLLADADLAAWLAVRGIVVMTPAEALATVDR
jgi:predicted nucleic acid-binding protein